MFHFSQQKFKVNWYKIQFVDINFFVINVKQQFVGVFNNTMTVLILKVVAFKRFSLNLDQKITFKLL